MLLSADVGSTLAENNNATPIAINDRIPGVLSGRDGRQRYEVQVTETGRLTVQASTGGQRTTKLSLLSGNGQLLASSDGQVSEPSISEIQVHLQSGRYFIEVASQAIGNTHYELASDFVPTFDYLAPVSTNVNTGDFNGDGITDLFNGQGSDGFVVLGLGDGSFGPPIVSQIDTSDFLIVDVNKDGRSDIICRSFSQESINVFLGNADGTLHEISSFGSGVVHQKFVLADLNRDGHVDLVSSDRSFSNVNGFSVFLGHGDGSFSLVEQRADFVVPNFIPTDFLTADVTGDGVLDLVVSEQVSSLPVQSGIIVFSGLGDGTFSAGILHSSPGMFVFRVAVADINSDGRQDLITIGVENNWNLFNVVVLLQEDSGDFLPPILQRIPQLRQFYQLFVKDFDGDQRPDVLVADTAASEPNGLVFLSQWNGDRLANVVSQPKETITRSSRGTSVEAIDFENDGRWEVLVTPLSGELVEAPFIVRLTDESSLSFEYPKLIEPAAKFNSIGVADFDTDGKTDLAIFQVPIVAVSAPLKISRGLPDGTFVGQSTFPKSAERLVAIEAADLNNDGRQDLIKLSYSDRLQGRLSISLGQGDGTFVEAHSEKPFGVLQPEVARLLVADVNADGRVDIITAFTFYSSVDGEHGEVQVYLGLGDGDFASPTRINLGRHEPLGDSFVADLNHDRLPDLIFTTRQLNDDGDVVSCDATSVLGLPDGSFSSPVSVSFGVVQTAGACLADLNGDGFLDFILSAAKGGNAEVRYSIAAALNDQHGSFGTPIQIAALPQGDVPIELAVTSHFMTDHRDRVLVNVLRQERNALYLAGVSATSTSEFTQVFDFSDARLSSVAIGDLKEDQLDDVVLQENNTTLGHSVTVLPNLGRGMLGSPIRFKLTERLSSPLVVRDVNKDGHLDVTGFDGRSEFDSHGLRLLLGDGRGTFRRNLFFPVVGTDTFGVVKPASITGDSIDDFLVTNASLGTLGVFASAQDGNYSLVSDVVTAVFDATPQVADINGDGADDVVQVNRSGDIIFRRGILGEPGTFSPPIVVNRDVTPARSVTVVGDSIVALNLQEATVSVYQSDKRGVFAEVNADNGKRPTTSQARRLATGTIPVLIDSGDLNRDGVADIVVVNHGSRNLTIFWGRRGGGFVRNDSALDTAMASVFQIGASPSDLSLLDVAHDGFLDIVITQASSGDVSVIHNLGGAHFAQSRYRAGDGIYEVVTDANGSVVKSDNQTLGFTVLDANEDGKMDLVVANADAHEFRVLLGTSNGGFVNPERGRSIFTPHQRPKVFQSGDFNNDGHKDLVVAFTESSKLWIYFGNGHGSFVRSEIVDAVTKVGGLTVLDSDHDGRVDLLIGNEFGDLLTMLGNGDGTFRRFTRAERNVPLAVADLDGDGRDDVVLANQNVDRLSVQFRTEANSFATESEQSRSDGLLGPGAVKLADLNGDGIKDLIVANSGSNTVLVSQGLAGGAFGLPTAYTVGTRPVGVTLEDVNNDGQLDMLVANQGSNDVTLLLSGTASVNTAATTSNPWVTYTTGPRLQAGTGAGTVSVQVIPDATGNGIADMLVTNSQSGQLLLLPGRSNGFFNDQLANLNSGNAEDPRSIPIGTTSLQGGTVADNSFFAVNPNANSVTFIASLSDFFRSSNPSSLVRSFDTGGEGPSSLLTADFNGDSHLDLLVANTADGSVSLMLGDGEGFSLEQLLRDPSLAHPSALALARVEDHLEIYVTDQGEEIATIIDLEIAMRTETTTTTTAITVSRGVNAGLPGQPFGFALVVAILLPGGQPESLGSRNADWVRLLVDLFDSADADVRQQALQQVGDMLWRLVSSPQQTTGELAETLAVSATRSLLTQFGVDADAPEVSGRIQTLARLVVSAGVQQATWLRALEETANVLRTLLPSSPINPSSSALPQSTTATSAKAMSSNERASFRRMSEPARAVGERREDDDIVSEVFGRSSFERVFNLIDEVSDVIPSVKREEEVDSSSVSEAWMIPLLAGMASADSDAAVSRRSYKRHGRTGRNRRQGV